MHKMAAEVADGQTCVDTQRKWAVVRCNRCAHLSVDEHRQVLIAGRSFV